MKLIDLIKEYAAATHGKYMGLPPARGHSNATRAAAASLALDLEMEIERRLELVAERAGDDDGTVRMMLDILDGHTT